jgi:hypothetical protein
MGNDRACQKTTANDLKSGRGAFARADKSPVVEISSAQPSTPAAYRNGARVRGYGGRRSGSLSTMIFVIFAAFVVREAFHKVRRPQ